jgi:hypothetical protein
MYVAMIAFGILPALARLRVEGASLGAGELLMAAKLLRSSRITRESLRGERSSPIVAAVLSPQIDALVANKTVEDTIERAIDEDGQVRDDASSALKKIRRELKGSQGEMVNLLERAMAKLEPHQRVADMSVTVRNGRFVIPVRREARGVVGGIVHDASATGGSVRRAARRRRDRKSHSRLQIGEVESTVYFPSRPTSFVRTVTRLELTRALITTWTRSSHGRYAIEFRCARGAAEPTRASLWCRDATRFSWRRGSTSLPSTSDVGDREDTSHRRTEHRRENRPLRRSGSSRRSCNQNSARWTRLSYRRLRQHLRRRRGRAVILASLSTFSARQESGRGAELR